MNIQQLAEKAGEIINTSPVSNPNMILDMPGQWGKSGVKYLAGQNSPKGEIIHEFTDRIIVRFDAIDILAFCVANGAQVNVVLQSAQQTRCTGRTKPAINAGHTSNQS